MTSTEARVPLRRTRQRALVWQALEGADQLLTAQQVHRLLVDGGQPVGLATVYRALASMAAAGEVDTVRTGNEVAYRRCSRGHHHHLTCRACGRAVEIAAPPLEQWAASVAAEHGFSSAGHIIEITGLCPACQPL